MIEMAGAPSKCFGDSDVGIKMNQNRLKQIEMIKMIKIDQNDQNGNQNGWQAIKIDQNRHESHKKGCFGERAHMVTRIFRQTPAHLLPSVSPPAPE